MRENPSFTIYESEFFYVCVSIKSVSAKLHIKAHSYDIWSWKFVSALIILTACNKKMKNGFFQCFFFNYYPSPSVSLARFDHGPIKLILLDSFGPLASPFADWVIRACSIQLIINQITYISFLSISLPSNLHNQFFISLAHVLHIMASIICWNRIMIRVSVCKWYLSVYCLCLWRLFIYWRVRGHLLIIPVPNNTAERGKKGNQQAPTNSKNKNKQKRQK